MVKKKKVNKPIEFYNFRPPPPSPYTVPKTVQVQQIPVSPMSQPYSEPKTVQVQQIPVSAMSQPYSEPKTVQVQPIPVSLMSQPYSEPKTVQVQPIPVSAMPSSYSVPKTIQVQPIQVSPMPQPYSESKTVQVQPIPVSLLPFTPQLYLEPSYVLLPFAPQPQQQSELTSPSSPSQLLESQLSLICPVPMYNLVLEENTFSPSGQKVFSSHENSAFSMYLDDIEKYNKIIIDFELFNKEIENLEMFLTYLFEDLVNKNTISKEEFDKFKNLMLIKFENAKENIVKTYLYISQVIKDIDHLDNSNFLKAKIKINLNKLNNKHINSTLIFSDFFEWFQDYNYNPISVSNFMDYENLTSEYFHNYFGILVKDNYILKLKNMFKLWIKLYILRIIDINFEKPWSVWGFNTIKVLNRKMWDIKIEEFAKQMVRNRINNPTKNPIYSLYEIMQAVSMDGFYMDGKSRSSSITIRDNAKKLGHSIFTYNKGKSENNKKRINR